MVFVMQSEKYTGGEDCYGHPIIRLEDLRQAAIFSTYATILQHSLSLHPLTLCLSRRGLRPSVEISQSRLRY